MSPMSVMMLGAVLLSAFAASGAHAGKYSYSLSIVKDDMPLISLLNPKGHGYTPCNYTFSPAWIQASPGTNGSTASGTVS